MLSVLPLAPLGCGPPPKDPAVAAYEQLERAIRSADAELLWATVTPASQDLLREKLALGPDADAEAVSERLGVRAGWPFELAMPRPARLDPAKSSAERRIVVAPYGVGEWRVPVERVGDGWRVDLTEALAGD